ncbi:MAG: 16S rRNA (guanine(527)-N(7))-methyltransferase RsmG [Hyphomicrobium sp.]
MGPGGPLPVIGDRDGFGEAFPVSRETLDRLETYAALLRRWQSTINLVAPSTLDAIWHRHFADSAQLLSHIPHSASGLLDIGSGAGFPGLVMAILLEGRQECRATLIESDSRKAAFLREVARATGVAVDILCARIESATTHAKVGQIDVVSARALAPMSRLLGLAQPFLSPGAKGLFLKGREVEAELAEARKRWDFSVELVPSRTAPDACIAIIGGLSARLEDRVP